MNDDSPDLKTAILERIRADAPRKVWTPADFVDLASRDAVDKTLQRLTNAKNGCGSNPVSAGAAISLINVKS